MSSSCRSPRRSLLSIVYSSAVIPAFTPPYPLPLPCQPSPLPSPLPPPPPSLAGLAAYTYRGHPCLELEVLSPGSCPLYLPLSRPPRPPRPVYVPGDVPPCHSPLMSPCPHRLVHHVSRSLLGSVYAYCGRDEGSYTYVRDLQYFSFSSGARTHTRTLPPVSVTVTVYAGCP